MSFANPRWLAAGVFACLLLVWLWRRYDARQNAALATFVSERLRTQLTQSVSIARRRLQRTLLLAALACLFIALAGPLLGFRWERISSRGNEIIFAVDTSRSMLTPDLKPNRLERAKLAIDDLAGELDGDAMGIVAFAGSAFLVCPITLDYGAFRESLGAIDTATIPRGGTNIASAIREAQFALRRRAGTDKILILITDGEDLEGGALSAAEAAAKEDGLKIYTVGVGTAAGDLIPLPPSQGGGFVKDDTGAFVKSRLDEPALQAIARATGGLYVPLGAHGEGLESILKTRLGALTKHDLSYRQQKIYTQRFQWPLAASLACLLCSLLVGSRRRRFSPKPTIVDAVAATAVMSLLVLTGDPSYSADGSPPAQSDVKKNPIEDFNAGTRAYRAGLLSNAEQGFQQSINHAPSPDLKRLADQEDAYYNLGNTLYRTGQKSEKSAPQDALKKWNEAVKAYETALQLRPDDADAKFNRDLVKRKIDALQSPQNQDQNKGQGKGQGQGEGQGQGQPQNSPGAPPQNAGSPPSPPQSASQPPPQSPTQSPQHGSGQPSASAGDASQDADDARSADNQHVPGQMSREEARELLDSVKGDERHGLGAPLATRGDDHDPDKPFRNW